MEITFFENNHEKCNNINKKQEFVQLPLRKTTTTKTRFNIGILTSVFDKTDGKLNAVA